MKRFVFFLILLGSGAILNAMGRPVVATPVETKTITLEEEETIRTLKNGALEAVVDLPKGSVLRIPTAIDPQNYYLRLSDGTLRWSSNFYFGGVQVEKVAAGSSSTPDQLNAIATGLYVATFIASELFGDSIPPVKPQAATAEYLQYFEASGQPKFNYSTYYKSRFGDRLNKAVDPTTLSTAMARKWEKVFAELEKLASRTQPVATSTLFMNRDDAKKFATLYENTGEVQTAGAWSIAVQGTAMNHGFADKPCAEFVSEMVRQSYRKAGFRHDDDFNATLKNPLIWWKVIAGIEFGSAAVVNLANYLDRAGWIPWETALYKPVTGAPMMHAKGTTPGHAYLVGGADGRIIVDNGSPYGKDLRNSPGKYLDMMYKHGVFFLPPGNVPAKW